MRYSRFFTPYVGRFFGHTSKRKSSLWIYLASGTRTAHLTLEERQKVTPASLPRPGDHPPFIDPTILNVCPNLHAENPPRGVKTRIQAPGAGGKGRGRPTEAGRGGGRAGRPTAEPEGGSEAAKEGKNREEDATGGDGVWMSPPASDQARNIAGACVGPRFHQEEASIRGKTILGRDMEPSRSTKEPRRGDIEAVKRGEEAKKGPSEAGHPGGGRGVAGRGGAMGAREDIRLGETASGSAEGGRTHQGCNEEDFWMPERHGGGDSERSALLPSPHASPPLPPPPSSVTRTFSSGSTSSNNSTDPSYNLSHPSPPPALAPLPSSFPPSPGTSPSVMTMWEMLASAFQSAYAQGHIERERVIQTLRVWTVEQYITGYDHTWGVAGYILKILKITDEELNRAALSTMAEAHKILEQRPSTDGSGSIDLRSLPTFRVLDDGETPLLLMRFKGQRLTTVVNAAFESSFFTSAEIEAQRKAASMILEFVLAKAVAVEDRLAFFETLARSVFGGESNVSQLLKFQKRNGRSVVSLFRLRGVYVEEIRAGVGVITVAALPSPLKYPFIEEESPRQLSQRPPHGKEARGQGRGTLAGRDEGGRERGREGKRKRAPSTATAFLASSTPVGVLGLEKKTKETEQGGGKEGGDKSKGREGGHMHKDPSTASSFPPSDPEGPPGNLPATLRPRDIRRKRETTHDPSLHAASTSFAPFSPPAPVERGGTFRAGREAKEEKEEETIPFYRPLPLKRPSSSSSAASSSYTSSSSSSYVSTSSSSHSSPSASSSTIHVGQPSSNSGGIATREEEKECEDKEPQGKSRPPASAASDYQTFPAPSSLPPSLPPFFPPSFPRRRRPSGDYLRPDEEEGEGRKQREALEVPSQARNPAPHEKALTPVEASMLFLQQELQDTRGGQQQGQEQEQGLRDMREPQGYRQGQELHPRQQFVPKQEPLGQEEPPRPFPHRDYEAQQQQQQQQQQRQQTQEKPPPHAPQPPQQHLQSQPPQQQQPPPPPPPPPQHQQQQEQQHLSDRQPQPSKQPQPQLQQETHHYQQLQPWRPQRSHSQGQELPGWEAA
ncbi:hypothetical protein Naga_100685g1 [Nannochloropsis gaditana]|uniref:Uncharacterized protein n=2 Tax=Nannochloropsis gaditana TaxID=72520 RepID=W7TJP1_9STRA|nr:hypothetical protein Naga_100685g1 [Nannochloropsis gaditana]